MDTKLIIECVEDKSGCFSFLFSFFFLIFNRQSIFGLYNTKTNLPSNLTLLGTIPANLLLHPSSGYLFLYGIKFIIFFFFESENVLRMLILMWF